ncbi:MAG: uroporphyrinogen decarboxylase family protein [Kiritimatiellia bacterium]|nr:uroporphyrinogen decarboxylase family protein [Kiritimatiellia bacterium]MDP6809848.1 uroporphyrinogen decarboxylase family protein [Kiritimatiellia bacterium]MDP7024240.1 uroporphyrinogen decarboxylase family protein [Kiritimatiellia bacterium]
MDAIIADYFTPARKQAFWRENESCYLRDPDGPATRPPFTLILVEDWIKEYMGLQGSDRYYTDMAYQQSVRNDCSRRTLADIGKPVSPAINLGSTVFASLFGGTIRYPGSGLPWIDPVITDPSDVKKLLPLTKEKNILQCGQVAFWTEAYLALFTSADEAARPRFGTYFHGMATLGCMLVGATDFLYMMTDYPQETKLLMDIIVDVGITFMDAMRELTGESPTGLMLANDDLWLLSPPLFESFCLDPERRLFQHYASSPGDMRGYHSDSPCTHIFDDLASLDLTDINLAPHSSLAELRQAFPDTVIHGQIAPLAFRDISAQDAADLVRDLVAFAAADRHVVLSVVGCLNEGTPIANILAAMWAIEHYGAATDSPPTSTDAPATRRLLKGMPMMLEVE